MGAGSRGGTPVRGLRTKYPKAEKIFRNVP